VERETRANVVFAADESTEYLAHGVWANERLRSFGPLFQVLNFTFANKTSKQKTKNKSQTIVPEQKQT